MSLIIKKIRKTSGGYLRLFGVDEIANFITSIHAAVISTGTQMSEKLNSVYEGGFKTFSGKDVSTPKKTLKLLLENPNGAIIFGGFIPNPKKKRNKTEIDMIILNDGVLYCYEIKEGGNLDTKKSEIEIDVIELAQSFFSQYYKKVEIGIVSFYMQNGEHQIKNNRAEKYVVSGEFVCDKFNFNYLKFCEIQTNEQPENIKFFYREAAELLPDDIIEEQIIKRGMIDKLV